MDDVDADIIRRSAIRLYAQGQPIWEHSDRWNLYKRAQIDRFIKKYASEKLRGAQSVLNAGSGGEKSDWLSSSMVNLDLFYEQVRKLPNPVAGSLTQLPFPNDSFDLCICVGSVLNYAPVTDAIREIARVTRTGGAAILHWESSSSFEHVFRTGWNKAAVKVETVNAGRHDSIWVYSPKFVAALLEVNRLRPIAETSFHTLSPLAVRLGSSQQSASYLARMDVWLKGLSFFSDDKIIMVEKI